MELKAAMAMWRRAVRSNLETVRELEQAEDRLELARDAIVQALEAANGDDPSDDPA